MKIKGSFYVELCLEQHGFPGGVVYINNLSLFNKILNLGYTDFWLRPTYHNNTILSGGIKIEDEADSSRLNEVIGLIKCETGIEPLPLSYIPHDQLESHYCIRYDRNYEKADLDAAPFLRIKISRDSSQLAQASHQKEDESYAVQFDGKQKKACQFGSLYPHACYGVAAALKVHLESAGLTGLGFEPIEIIPPEKAVKPLWKIKSTIRLPRCALPWVHLNGLPFSGDYSQWSYVDDGGYFPEEFSYFKSDLKLCGEFDVAETMERISAGGRFRHREIIVSQRFRQAIEAFPQKSGLGMDFVPVRIQE